MAILAAMAGREARVETREKILREQERVRTPTEVQQRGESMAEAAWDGLSHRQRALLDESQSRAIMLVYFDLI